MTEDQRTAELKAGLEVVDARIRSACAAVDRDPEGVTLVVVTKFFPAADVTRLHDLGVRHIGENRHQEAADKVAELDPRTRADLTVHFIGQLQSNKAAAVTSYADVVQSVDRAKVVAALDRAAAQRDRRLSVTLQVDLAGSDAARGGVAPHEIGALADAVADSAQLDLRGVMAVAPLGADPAPAFARLRELAEDVHREHPDATWISAGMSGDLEAAVAAGATHLRVGSAILGSRPALR
ncbi:YggS family pyridoxal phosphate-dependent enzyme [Luteipulveratus mongoliensis]|uniref:Pyridoxal phosphate homeostasis protein n=1 Tax=Luteipulveratus mongoliensis TaxID=571913 RepID=A0A0K1JKH0_9MICO|nr:YggS family pyridoxal phosphate-dependent enzyme [Luteipulveratus mongoliensis]AKU17209.1 alanine racemase [Luteipulveratus mongoliensis]